MKLFGSLYERVMQWSRHDRAEYYLGVISFAESSFFPIPVDVMLAPMALAKRNRWIRLAGIATFCSVLGGVVGYAIGYGFFGMLEPWLRESHYWGWHETSKLWFDDYGVWIVLIAGFSPIPYKAFTITAGVAMLNLPSFIIASIIGRAGRFFLIAGLMRAGGQRFEDTLTKYIERIGWAVVLIAIMVLVWIILRG